jgi:hypothetical protein
MALFSLNVHMARPSSPFLSSMGPQYNRASTYIYTTLVALVADSQNLVSQAVTLGCNRDLQSADEQVQEDAKKRLKLLAKWQKCKYPFAWGDKASTYSMLVKLFPNEEGGITQLPRSNTTLTHTSLGEKLVKLGLNKKIEAPLVKNGICSTALQLTVPLTLGTMKADKVETIKIWTAGLQTLHIHFLPWSGDHPNAKATTVKSWVFPQSSSKSNVLGILDKGASQEIAAQEIAETTSKQDPSAPWKVPKLISEMGPLWKKRCLPVDWDLKHASIPNTTKHAYIKETYLWVSTNFDGEKTIHRLGIVLAIMFSRLLPNIAYPGEKESIIPEKLPLDDLNRYIQELEWLTPTHKGVSQPEPFITMLSTYIIALGDSDSPLLKYLEEHENAFGNPWTDKHCE